MKTLNIEGLTCYSVEQTVASSPLSNSVKQLLLKSDPTNDYYSKGRCGELKQEIKKQFN